MLGVVGLVVDGRDIALTPRLQRVLAALLLQPGAVVNPELLASTDHDSARRMNGPARVAVSRLRSALEPYGLGDRIVTAGPGYRLLTHLDTVDHVELAVLSGQAATKTPAERHRILSEARAAWGGTPFGQFRYEEAFTGPATRLEEMYRGIVDAWGEAALEAGLHRAVVAQLAEDAEAEPLREVRWSHLMLAHARCGNTGSALAAFERAAATIDENFGADPTPDLVELRQQIEAGHPDIEWRPPPFSLRPPERIGIPPMFVGREHELDDVTALLNRHRAVEIVGLGGIGKSSLAGEVAARWEGPVHIVSLAGATNRDRVERVVADVLGISSSTFDHQIHDAIADRLRQDRALVVLDNCDDALHAVGALVAILSRSSPITRFLVTSRRSLDTHGVATLRLGPLAIGAPDAPGPAALLVADIAEIRPSSITMRWEEIEDICHRSGGIPLALRLLANRSATGRWSAREMADDSSVSGDPVAAAISEAADSLEAADRRVLDMVAALPTDVGVEFLASLLDESPALVVRHIRAITRTGLAEESIRIGDFDGDTSDRVRVLAPVREALPHLPGSAWDRVTATIVTLAERARPNVIGPVNRAAVMVLDDENDLVMSTLEQVAPATRLRLAVALTPVWHACGRTAPGDQMLRAVEPSVGALPAVEQAEYWVARATISPSMASRSAYLEQLRFAEVAASSAGHDDLASRALVEMAIGLGWSGRIAEACELLERLAKRPERGEWSALKLASLRALTRGMLGDPRGAARDLVAVGRSQHGLGHLGDVLSNYFLAVNLARLAGDDELVDRILNEAACYQPDRFGAYGWAGLAFERAQLAMRTNASDSTALLEEALIALRHWGEHRTAAVCEQHLGTALLAKGDRTGVRHLTAAARLLRGSDARAMSVCLAHLVRVADDLEMPEDRDILRVAVGHFATLDSGAPLGASDAAVVAEALAGAAPDASQAGVGEPVEDPGLETDLMDVFDRLDRIITLDL